MRTIRTRFLNIICGLSLTLTLLLGGLCVYLVDSGETNSAVYSLNGQVIRSAADINLIFLHSEDSVQFVANTLEHSVQDPAELKSRAKRDEVEAQLNRAFYNAVSNIKGINGYYVHFNEDLAGEADGFWYARVGYASAAGENRRFMKQAITNATAYGPDDTTRTGWYYEPLKTKGAVWMDPYVNASNGVRMITYAIPVYVKGQFVGIAGIDIDFNYLCTIVGAIKAYESGGGILFRDLDTFYSPLRGTETMDARLHLVPTFGVLENDSLLNKKDTDGTVLHYYYNGTGMEMAFTTLRNGMKLGVTAPTSEIYAGRKIIVCVVIILLFVVVLLSILIAMHAADRIIRPLRDISEAAKRMGRGEYDKPLAYAHHDEIGLLAGHMNDTMTRMRDYVGTMKRQAYRDELTQVKNVAAYDYKIAQLDQIILSKKPLDFGVVMVDLNQLKLVNDRFGHEKGNIAIKSLCQAVCRIYKHSPVYRVGGDEFVVILEGEDYQKREALFEQVRAFEKKRDMEGESPWTQLSASLGMAVYEPRRDKIYQDVFNRADAKMYECKQRLGACR